MEELYRRSGLPAAGDVRSTDVAQPAIIAASLAALGVLRDLGIDAVIAVGHSLGELAALHWAGAIDADSLLRIAAAAGRAMARSAGRGRRDGRRGGGRGSRSKACSTAIPW